MAPESTNFPLYFKRHAYECYISFLFFIFLKLWFMIIGADSQIAAERTTPNFCINYIVLLLSIDSHCTIWIPGWKSTTCVAEIYRKVLIISFAYVYKKLHFKKAKVRLHKYIYRHIYIYIWCIYMAKDEKKKPFPGSSLNHSDRLFNYLFHFEFHFINTYHVYDNKIINI